MDNSGKRKWTNEEIKILAKQQNKIFIKQEIIGKYRFVWLKDFFGYKYYINISHLIEGKSSIVGKNNPFSLHNISLWLKLNKKNFILDKNNVYTHALKNKLKFFCKKCKSRFHMNWGNISQSQGCPDCLLSKGEEKIKHFLEENKIKYLREHRFQKCVNKKPLPFDFYLPDYNLCIEYNGEQHYKSRRNNFWGGDSELEKVQLRDKIKKKFCKDNNIQLLVIPYWKYKSIGELLERRLL